MNNYFSGHVENLLTEQLRGEACILHDEISRQKQIPN